MHSRWSLAGDGGECDECLIRVLNGQMISLQPTTGERRVRLRIELGNMFRSVLRVWFPNISERAWRYVEDIDAKDENQYRLELDQDFGEGPTSYLFYIIKSRSKHPFNLCETNNPAFGSSENHHRKWSVYLR